MRTTLLAVRNGEIDIDEACRRLATWPHESLPFATIDHQRGSRTGFPEVIYCSGKTPEQTASIADRIWSRAGRLLATRADEDHAAAIKSVVPAAVFNPISRTVCAGAPPPTTGPPILIVTAGTSDLAVAEEAAETARMMGQRVERLTDVGVAGVHRLLAHENVLADAGVVVVVAGMEGALASVVGGLVEVPVVAVPTSVGYGAAFEGLAALLTMLNSCAPGVMTVNIDNGFGAGFAAARINALRSAAEPAESGEVDRNTQVS